MSDTCRNCKNLQLVRTIDGTISESNMCIVDGYFMVNNDYHCEKWEESDENQNRIVIDDRYLTNGYRSLDNTNYNR